MSKSKIEWTDRVWNPVTGCTKVSEGCRNCYAERVAGRFWKDRPFTEVRCHPERLKDPLRWRKPCRVFVNSMSDLFHEKISDDFIFAVWSVMARSRQHIFQVLTKRPRRMMEFLKNCEGIGQTWREGHGAVCPNVWLGVSVEDQKTADERIPLLLQTPAAVRFVSAEPLLGPVNLRKSIPCPDCNGDGTLGKNSIRKYYSCEKCGGNEDGAGSGIDARIDWLICGGESGPGARPMHPDWARSLRDQCQEAGVPYFFKQWGEWTTAKVFDDKEYVGILGKSRRLLSRDIVAVRIGKKRAGRLLDGREWNEMPEEKP